MRSRTRHDRGCYSSQVRWCGPSGAAHTWRRPHCLPTRYVGPCRRRTSP